MMQKPFDFGGTLANALFTPTALFGVGPLGEWLGSSTDPTKLQDQEYLRMLAKQLAEANVPESKIQDFNPFGVALGGSAGANQLQANLAARGLGSSGVGGAALGSFYAGLEGQRAQGELGVAQARDQAALQRAQLRQANAMAGAQLLAGIGERPKTQGESLLAGGASLLGQFGPSLLKLLLGGAL